MSEFRYKVVWVDDLSGTLDNSFASGFESVADEYGIDLTIFTNWEEAEADLKKNFQSYSAVILDANCKYGKNDNTTDEFFIPSVVSSLARMFGEKRQTKPWYILSAGTMSKFDDVIQIAEREHAVHQEEWGNMVYLKDAIDNSINSVDTLFKNIVKVANTQNANIIAFNFQDVFKYLGEGKLICKEARTIMMDMLCTFYYPADNWQFKYDGNPLRKVMEYIFRAAYNYGLLPQECFERDNQLNLLESNRYMSGLVTKHSELRYGSDNDTIFPKSIGNITLQILNFTNTDSHTNEEHPYTIDDKDLEISENEKELYFSYVLQLCHVIKSFGAFIDKHPDKETNRKMKRAVSTAVPSINDSVTSPVGQRSMILVSENGPYILNCRLAPCFAKYEGKYAIITEINANKGKDVADFPYYAKINIEN
jgi:hypothetical protein|nr:hypothetical protein [Bacteroides intestinalis]